MSDLATLLNAFPLEGWQVSNVVRLTEDSWQVNITNEEHLVLATGDTIEAAFDKANDKASRGEYYGRLITAARITWEEVSDGECKPPPIQDLLPGLFAPKVDPNFKRRI